MQVHPPDNQIGCIAHTEMICLPDLADVLLFDKSTDSTLDLVIMGISFILGSTVEPTFLLSASTES